MVDELEAASLSERGQGREAVADGPRGPDPIVSQSVSERQLSAGGGAGTGRREATGVRRIVNRSRTVDVNNNLENFYIIAGHNL